MYSELNGLKKENNVLKDDISKNKTLLKTYNKEIYDLKKAHEVEKEKDAKQIETLREFKDKKIKQERETRKSEKKINKKNRKLEEEIEAKSLESVEEEKVNGQNPISQSKEKQSPDIVLNQSETKEQNYTTSFSDTLKEETPPKIRFLLEQPSFVTPIQSNKREFLFEHNSTSSVINSKDNSSPQKSLNYNFEENCELKMSNARAKGDRNSFQNHQLFQLRAQIITYRMLERHQFLPPKIVIAVSGGTQQLPSVESDPSPTSTTTASPTNTQPTAPEYSFTGTFKI